MIRFFFLFASVYTYSHIVSHRSYSIHVLRDRKNISSPTVSVLAITIPRSVNIMLITINSQIFYYKLELTCESDGSCGTTVGRSLAAPEQSLSQTPGQLVRQDVFISNIFLPQLNNSYLGLETISELKRHVVLQLIVPQYLCKTHALI